MGRSPCCSKVGLRRGPWSTKEDNLLTAFIQEHGEGQWRSLPKKAGLLRCGKSCRLRWMNYLRPGIKRGNITEDEEDLIVRLHRLLGNRWSLIAGRLPGRTDNEIKNHWNTHLLKKLKNAGIHPKPHKDLPKPAKTKKSAAVEKKRKQKKEPVILEENLSGPVQREQGISNTSDHEEDKGISPPPPPPAKIKVFSPKPIRVSPEFSRTSSYDSLASGESNSDGGEAARVAYIPVVASWPPLFELEYGGGEEDDFLSGGYILPVLRHSDSISSDVNMLEKVYDEYLQLL